MNEIFIVIIMIIVIIIVIIIVVIVIIVIVIRIVAGSAPRLIGRRTMPLSGSRSTSTCRSGRRFKSKMFRVEGLGFMSWDLGFRV